MPIYEDILMESRRALRDFPLVEEETMRKEKRMPLIASENKPQPDINKDIVKGERSILSMRVRRTENGLTLFLKSPPFEEWFRTTGARFHEWNGHRFYINPGKLRIPEYRLDLFDGLLFHNGFPTEVNLTWLRAVGLSEGVELPMNQVCSIAALRDYGHSFQDAVIFVYNNYLRPADMTLEIVGKVK